MTQCSDAFENINACKILRLFFFNSSWPYLSGGEFPEKMLYRWKQMGPYIWSSSHFYSPPPKNDAFNQSSFLPIILRNMLVSFFYLWLSLLKPIIYCRGVTPCTTLPFIHVLFLWNVTSTMIAHRALKINIKKCNMQLLPCFFFFTGNHHPRASTEQCRSSAFLCVLIHRLNRWTTPARRAKKHYGKTIFGDFFYGRRRIFRKPWRETRLSLRKSLCVEGVPSLDNRHQRTQFAIQESIAMVSRPLHNYSTIFWLW